jgi:enamine deaminase RidA (YjgF/YER057c/UK114 family)
LIQSTQGAKTGRPMHRLQILLAFVLALAGQAGSAAEIVKRLEPDSKTGTSKAVVVEDLSLVHTAQILPFDEGKRIVTGGISNQTERVLAVLRGVLSNARCDLSSVAKLNVYISTSNDMPVVCEVLAREFSSPNKPAATFVVTSLPDPAARIAMDAVAAPRFQSRISTVEWISPLRYHDREISAAALPPNGALIYVSGMADTNGLPDATRITLGKLMSTLGHLGLTKSDVIQLKAFFQPMSEAAVVRRAVVDFYGGIAPPTVFVEWVSPAPYPPIEIELIAAGKPDSTNDSQSVVFLTPPGTTSTKVFSRVAKVNRGKIIYISGLYGMNAREGESEVREIFQSLDKILKSTASDFEHLVKATYYVLDDLAGNKLNDIRQEFFNPLRPPAASKAKVRGVGIPDKTVTVDMIAVTK